MGLEPRGRADHGQLEAAAQAALWPDWRHFAFLTDMAGGAVYLDRFHRQHAVVELTIDDLKEGSGIDHIPSGNFSANGAWLCAAVLAHNLIRWTATIGSPRPIGELAVAATIRTRLINMPGRLINLHGTPTLRGPKRWPWAQWFNRRLLRLRALPLRVSPIPPRPSASRAGFGARLSTGPPCSSTKTAPRSTVGDPCPDAAAQ